VRCPATAFRFGRVRWSTPLDNLSGAPQEYFADGMNDELITMLAKDSTLRIVSRTTVMQYKGARRPLPEIARALGVDGILEGSISRTGMHVHLTLQLIRADTDAHLWAESYNRTGNDVAALPGEAARDVATRLHSSVASSRPARDVSPEAHDAYLRGWYFLGKREADKSATYFQRAISIDPSWSQENRRGPGHDVTVRCRGEDGSCRATRD
jgi:TolB-like protein